MKEQGPHVAVTPWPDATGKWVYGMYALRDGLKVSDLNKSSLLLSFVSYSDILASLLISSIKSSRVGRFEQHIPIF